MSGCPSGPRGSSGRVLVLTNDFPTRVGGIETFVHALCVGLDPADVVVYTASMPGGAEFDAGLPFPVYRDPAQMLLPTPAVARRAAEVMRLHGCDRVLFGASAPLGLLAPSLRRAGARRIVALTHGHEVWWAKLPVTRRLLRRIGDSVDVMTYVSQWCRGEISGALSAPAVARMAQLSPGVDPERFRPDCGGDKVRAQLGLEESTPVVVCTGRLVPRKGQDTLIRAWPAVLRAHPDARLLLVGRGSYRDTLEALAAQCGVRDSVIFAGGVPAEDLPAYMDAGDVFAMPCRTRRLGLEVEAFGIVFLEAAACGLPVVVGGSGGAPETCVPGETGLVVAPGDADDLAGALATLVGDVCRRSEMSRRGRELARSRSWRTTTVTVQKILGWCHERPGQAGRDGGGLERKG